MKMPHDFGLFVHWGVYSLTKWHEQYRLRTKIPRAEYAKLADEFNPTEYDPDQWVSMAKSAGMKYICFTAKHHDGFCMWDTKYTDFSIMNTPYGKDVLKMLSEACERQGMALSIYYSIPDANQINGYNPKSTHQNEPEEGDVPDGKLYLQYVKNQITELMTNYGRIYTLFWDIPPKIDEPSLNAYVRTLQPDILINDRGYDSGDFSTPERNVPDGAMFERLTEACQSVGRQSWGYRENEDYYSAKFIMQSMDKIMLMGGSYLLNVGPMPNGRIPEKAVKMLQTIGSWYCRVKESYENTTSEAMKEYYVTRRDRTVYLHFTRDLISAGVTLAPWRILPESAVVLNNLQPVEYGIETLPEDYREGRLQKPYLHLFNLPVDELSFEPIIIRLDF